MEKINIFHDDFHAIFVFTTHRLIFSSMISTLYRGENARIIKVNPFHDDTTADEKYQFTCSVVFSATEPSWKRINFRDGIVGNVKITLCPLYNAS